MTTVDLIDPVVFPDNLDRILAVLHNSKLSGNERMTAVEISNSLKADHGTYMHWRTINTILLKRPGLTDRKKSKGRWSFAILKDGAERIAATPTAILFVDPSKAVQAVLTLHNLLSQCRGVVRVCDPYLDDVTLQHLDACVQASEIRLLTRNVKDSGSLRSLYAAFHTQGKNLQVRVAAANVLHDRYIIDRGGMKIMGTSLNGFGKKQCFVIEGGADMSGAMLAVFDTHWTSATIWP